MACSSTPANHRHCSSAPCGGNSPIRATSWTALPARRLVHVPLQARSITSVASMGLAAYRSARAADSPRIPCQYGHGLQTRTGQRSTRKELAERLDERREVLPPDVLTLDFVPRRLGAAACSANNLAGPATTSDGDRRVKVIGFRSHCARPHSPARVEPGRESARRDRRATPGRRRVRCGRHLTWRGPLSCRSPTRWRCSGRWPQRWCRDGTPRDTRRRLVTAGVDACHRRRRRASRRLHRQR